MDSTGPIGPRKLPKTAPIKLPEAVTPAEPVALPPKPAPGGIVKDGLELSPHRTCKCAPGEITPGKTLKACMELPTKTIGRGCSIGIEPPTKTIGRGCGIEGPIQTGKICGIEGPYLTQKCPPNPPNLPIKTLGSCMGDPPITLKCNIGPIPKTLVGCNPGPIEPPIKTAKICSIIPPHPPIRTCWCPSDPGGPIKTINPIPGPSDPGGPIKTINPLPTAKCSVWPPVKPEQPVKTIDIITNPAPTPKCFNPEPPTHK
ncbi:MAG: hypothetical protein ACK46X_17385 [Candidatus Sericytochromatia bacterium]